MSMSSSNKDDVTVVQESEVPEHEQVDCESDSLENGILLFGDGDPSWLSSLLESIAHREQWRHESLLSCLVVLMYEMGFHLDGGPVNSSPSFDARVMRQLRSTHFLPNSRQPTVDNGVCTLNFRTPLDLNLMTLALVPVDSIVVVDLLASAGGGGGLVKPKSLAFDCGQFFHKEGQKIVVVNREKLSLPFKTATFELLTETISEPSSHPASILRLPIELLIRISSCLKVKDFVCFTMSCKQLYALSSDEMIWKRLAKIYFPARNLSGTYKEFCKYRYKVELERRQNLRHNYLYAPPVYRIDQPMFL